MRYFHFAGPCPSLPQTDSILFLMRYAGVNLGEQPDFFANYYPPAWSVIYWLTQNHPLSAERLKEADVTHAVTGQSLAMLLHSLDDHLIDGQVPASPLTLLLRSQAWTAMNSAFCNLAENVPAGEPTVLRFTDDYYTGNQDLCELSSLDSYCDRFRRQMAIWLTAPVLLSMKITGISEFTRDIERAYGSFGIAWRLLDDIKDIDEDIEKGAESAICVCLPVELRSQWKNAHVSRRPAATESTHAILNHILEHALIDKIRERICVELETAASLVEAHDLSGLAHELRCLAHPLVTGATTEEGEDERSGISPTAKRLPQC